MEDRTIKVVAMLNPSVWGKWPGTDDKVFKPIFSIVSPTEQRECAPGLRVEMRYGPVYAPRAWAGLDKPAAPWAIDNRVPAPPGVTDGMLYLLQELAKESEVILWPDARECYPEVARELPSLFKVRILAHADDCKWSTPIRTAPVARYFTHLIHWMWVYDQETGQTVPEVYATAGLPAARCFHGGYGSGQLHAAAPYESVNSDVIETRCRTLEAGVYPFEHDLSFVGTSGLPSFRLGWLQQLNKAAPPPPRAVLYGLGMRDGRLLPLDDPRGVGYPTIELYRKSFASLNIGLSSIYNLRLWGLWETGVLQVVVDRWRELEAGGFEDGVHFVRHEGGPETLMDTVDEWKARPKDAAAVIRTARRACDTHLQSHDAHGSLLRVLRSAIAEGLL